MLNKLNTREREHLARVKELPCSVCDASGPSEAHHYKQHRQYTCIALCESCHRGALMGLHGQRRAWAITFTSMWVLVQGRRTSSALSCRKSSRCKAHWCKVVRFLRKPRSWLRGSSQKAQGLRHLSSISPMPNHPRSRHRLRK